MIRYTILATVAVFCAGDPLPNDDKCKLINETMVTCLDSTAEDLVRIMNNKDIEWLVFTRANIPILKKSDLSQFPSLTDFLMKEGQLEEIEEDAFSEAKALKWVDVSLNKLTAIPSNILANNPAIYYLTVSGNPGLTVPKNSPFLNSLHLKWLVMSNASITELYPETFSNLEGLKFLSLSENQLTTLPYDVFKPLKHLSWLDLSKNQFKNVNFEISRPRPIAVFLSGNPWECDCNLFPMIEWAKTQRVRDEVTCVNPAEKKWNEVVLDCPIVSA